MKFTPHCRLYRLKVARVADGESSHKQFEHMFYTTAKHDSRQQLHKTLRTGRGITIQEEIWGWGGISFGKMETAEGKRTPRKDTLTRLLLQVHDEEHPQTSQRERRLIIRGRGMKY